MSVLVCGLVLFGFWSVRLEVISMLELSAFLVLICLYVVVGRVSVVGVLLVLS